ncbi:MAG: hypothetical protein Q9203_003875 [Teloschistes exilis]
MAPPTSTTLFATYTSPSYPTPKAFTYPLPSSNTTSLAEKTAYLSTLRESMIQLQDRVNPFLTKKMEEDKALAADAGVKVDEKKEEDFYGEEIDPHPMRPRYSYDAQNAQPPTADSVLVRPTGPSNHNAPQNYYRNPQVSTSLSTHN